MKKGKHSAEDVAGAVAYEDMSPYGEDQTLKELVERLVRIYWKGDVEKKAHVVVFLNSAAPGE